MTLAPALIPRGKGVLGAGGVNLSRIPACREEGGPKVDYTLGDLELTGTKKGFPNQYFWFATSWLIKDLVNQKFWFVNS